MNTNFLSVICGMRRPSTVSVPNAHTFHAGMRVSVHHSVGSRPHASLTIRKVTERTKTLEIDGEIPLGLVKGDLLVFEGGN